MRAGPRERAPREQAPGPAKACRPRRIRPGKTPVPGRTPRSLPPRTRRRLARRPDRPVRAGTPLPRAGAARPMAAPASVDHPGPRGARLAGDVPALATIKIGDRAPPDVRRPANRRGAHDRQTKAAGDGTGSPRTGIATPNPRGDGRRPKTRVLPAGRTLLAAPPNDAAIRRVDVHANAPGTTTATERPGNGNCTTDCGLRHVAPRSVRRDRNDDRTAGVKVHPPGRCFPYAAVVPCTIRLPVATLGESTPPDYAACRHKRRHQ